MKKVDMTIRPGDQVMILTPKFFIRVGYEIEPSSFSQAFYEPVIAFLRLHTEMKDPDKFGRQIKNICRDMSYIKAKRLGFGGQDRKIYETDPIPTARKIITQVQEVFHKKTGVYSPAYYNDIYGDWEPASLLNECTHKILRLTESFHNKKTNDSCDLILARHCVKINPGFSDGMNYFEKDSKKHITTRFKGKTAS